MRKIVFVITFFALEIQFGFATEWYVTSANAPIPLPNGDGTSWDNPWVGFSNLNWLVVSPGDTIYIDGGVKGNTLVYNEGLSIQKSGEEGNRITFCIDAEDQSHNGIVKIDLENVQFFSHGIDLLSNNYITIDGYNANIRTINQQGHGIIIDNGGKGHEGIGYGININGKNNLVRYIDQAESGCYGICIRNGGGHNTINHCRIHDNTSVQCTGVLIQNSAYNVIDHCEVFNNRASGVNIFESQGTKECSDYNYVQYSSVYKNGHDDYDQTHGIYIGAGSSWCRVLYCAIYENSGFGIHANQNGFYDEIKKDSLGNDVKIYVPAVYNVIQYNNVYDNGNGGIIASGKQLQTNIQFNTVYYNKIFGISTRDDSTGYIMNNTFICNGHSRKVDGADGDYLGTLNWSINDNSYYETAANEVLIRWGGTVYTAGQFYTYRNQTNEDLHSILSLSRVNEYETCVALYNWLDATTPNPLNDNDNGCTSINLPFDFIFFGKKYLTGTAISAWQNGGISFSTNFAKMEDVFLYDTDPYDTLDERVSWPSDKSVFQEVIAPWYSDLINNGNPGSIFTSTFGTAPNRVFVIEWDDCRDKSENENAMNFELVLYESTNVIEFQYNSLDLSQYHVSGINMGSGGRCIQLSDSEIAPGAAVRFSPIKRYRVEYSSNRWFPVPIETEFIYDMDDGYRCITIPFSFTFYGETYPANSTIRVYANGVISFDIDNAEFTDANVSGTTWPSNKIGLSKAIAPWYADLHIPDCGAGYGLLYTLSTQVDGVNAFIIAWNQCISENNEQLKFEVILRADNAIEFCYSIREANSAILPHAPGINAGDGSQGIQLGDQTTASQMSVKFIPN